MNDERRRGAVHRSARIVHRSDHAPQRAMYPRASMESEPRLKKLTTEKGVPVAIRDAAYYDLAVAQIIQKKFGESLKTTQALLGMSKTGESVERAFLLQAQIHMEQGNLGSGDGFSNFEEFRGFVVAGSVTRLNPRRKEVFLDVDPEFLLSGPVASPIDVLSTLQVRPLYLEPDEVKGDDQPSRALLRTRGVVNPNRSGVPVAHRLPQRAVRLIYQSALPPAIHLAGPNIDVPVWQVGILGATMSDDIYDIDVLNTPGNVGTVESPMRTQFSEVYSRTFTNLAVNTTFSFPYHYDIDGNVVPQCTHSNQANCDVWDLENHLIVPALQDGVWGILYTVPNRANDLVEHYSLQARRCSDGGRVVGGLTSFEMERLKGLIAAHEAGHAMRIEHLRNGSTDCGDLMFDDEGTGGQRRAMSNHVPQPSGFSDRDHAMIRLWQP